MSSHPFRFLLLLQWSCTVKNTPDSRPIFSLFPPVWRMHADGNKTTRAVFNKTFFLLSLVPLRICILSSPEMSSSCCFSCFLPLKSGIVVVLFVWCTYTRRNAPKHVQLFVVELPPSIVWIKMLISRECFIILSGLETSTSDAKSLLKRLVGGSAFYTPPSPYLHVDKPIWCPNRRNWPSQ